MKTHPGIACGTSARRVTSLLTIAAASAVVGGAPAPGERLAPVLPPEFYAVPGHTISVFFDDVVLTRHPESLCFDVRCPLGDTGDRAWSVTPGPGDVGRHPFEIVVRDRAGREYGRALSTLCVAPSDAGRGTVLRLLLVGDSLTHATVYANALSRLLSAPGNPQWKMLGTHRPPQALPGVCHEGYGGWTWQRFLEHYEPHPDGTYRKRSSPFVFVDEKTGRPGLDIPRYIREHCAGVPPNVVIFLLGINDCFHVNPDDPAAVDARIDRVLATADRLLGAFHAAVPDALLGVCLPPAPNAREAAFRANYKGRYHRWGWKRIQFRLAEKMLEHFGSADRRYVSLIPLELGVDPVDGYPENNGVHPNARGYGQIAEYLYAWLKWRMAHGGIAARPPAGKGDGKKERQGP